MHGTYISEDYLEMEITENILPSAISYRILKVNSYYVLANISFRIRLSKYWSDLPYTFPSFVRICSLYV